MTKVFNGRQSSLLSSKGTTSVRSSSDPTVRTIVATTSASAGVFYRVRPVSAAQTQVVVHYSTSGRKNYRESVPTRNNLERFIGIWADLSEEDEKLFDEIFAERKSHFDRPLLDLFDA
jgi:hypothetical protein